ncbi:MAG: hypothetical protein RQ761_03875 [Bacteroidales bacterium]|nr:hypothetical protein [Bacteroidales bacterium]
MKTLKIMISLALVAFFAVHVHAQKITLEEGSLDFIQGIDELNVEYDFSDFGVGKFATEAEYIEKKKNDYNEDEPGKGDDWEAEWHADKENTYQRRFEELMNTVFLSKDANIMTGPYTNADYTLILKTTFLEPGFNIGISRKNASINVEAIFVETEAPENIVARISMAKVPGNGLFAGDFDAEMRIGEAYAKAGQSLATYLWKKVLR